MTLKEFHNLLDRVSQIDGIDTKAIEKIRKAVANGDTKLTFSALDFFTLTQLQGAGFSINILDMPYAGEGGEA